MRELKNHLYEQVARIGKAVASPKRLELIELLCQGEKTVEMLAAQAEISVKLTSAHLKELRLARLVDTRKDGKYVLYRLASTSVADLWVHLRSEAEERLVELQMALASLVEHGEDLRAVHRGHCICSADMREEFNFFFGPSWVNIAPVFHFGIFIPHGFELGYSHIFSPCVFFVDDDGKAIPSNLKFPILS